MGKEARMNQERNGHAPMQGAPGMKCLAATVWPPTGDPIHIPGEDVLAVQPGGTLVTKGPQEDEQIIYTGLPMEIHMVPLAVAVPDTRIVVPVQR